MAPAAMGFVMNDCANTVRLKMNRATSLRRGAALMLICFAGAAPLQAQTLHAAADRITDQAIAADHGAYAATQARVKALNDKGLPLRDYHLSKAQCWLDVSLHEYTRNDRSAFPQQALAQSAAILFALETGVSNNPGDATALVNGADKLRPDLWARFAAVRQGAGAVCAAQRVACGEVELVHAGNEIRQQGWRHANPYVQIAEDHARAAEEAAAACVAPAPAPAPPMAAAAPMPGAAPAPVLARETLELAADALFRFDKAGLADLLPQGRARIDAMLAQLDTVYARIERITLTGHTDRLGSDAYNQDLSERRAATVRAYLLSAHPALSIVSAGKGESEQVAACSAVKPRAALIACLQPNRRVEVAISGLKR